MLLMFCYLSFFFFYVEIFNLGANFHEEVNNITMDKKESIKKPLQEAKQEYMKE